MASVHGCRLPGENRGACGARRSAPGERCTTSGSPLAARAREPYAGAWALPGGALSADEPLEESARRHLAAKVDVKELSHLEQLETLSEPGRNPCREGARDGVPRARPRRRRPAYPGGHAWHPVDGLPGALRTTTKAILLTARERSSGKALIHESRLRASAAELSTLRRAPRHLRRGASRPSRHRDESPAASSCAGQLIEDTGERQRHYGERGRQTGRRIYRFLQSRARGNGSVRRPSSAYNGRLGGRQDSQVRAGRAEPGTVEPSRDARCRLRPRRCDRHSARDRAGRGGSRERCCSTRFGPFPSRPWRPSPHSCSRGEGAESSAGRSITPAVHGV